MAQLPPAPPWEPSRDGRSGTWTLPRANRLRRGPCRGGLGLFAPQQLPSTYFRPPPLPTKGSVSPPAGLLGSRGRERLLLQGPAQDTVTTESSWAWAPSCGPTSSRSALSGAPPSSGAGGGGESRHLPPRPLTIWGHLTNGRHLSEPQFSMDDMGMTRVYKGRLLQGLPRESKKAEKAALCTLQCWGSPAPPLTPEMVPLRHP